MLNRGLRQAVALRQIAFALEYRLQPENSLAAQH